MSSENEPKLRVLDDQERASESVVRLSGEGEAPEPVSRLELRPPQEPTRRLEGDVREAFEGRTAEPSVEAILPNLSPSIEQKWGETAQGKAPIPYGWFVLLVVFLGSAVFMAFHSSREPKADGEQSPLAAQQQQREDHEEALALIAALEIEVRGYLGAASIDEMLPRLRQPERVQPLMREWYRTHPLPQPASPVKISNFAALDIRGRPFWQLEAVMKDGSVRRIVLEQTSPSAGKVDWELDVRCQPMPWSAFVAGEAPDRSVDLRVLCARDNYYIDRFSDDRRWSSFQLSDREDGDHLYAFAPADGEVAATLKRLCAGAPAYGSTVILRLRVPSDVKTAHLAVIEALVAPDWCLFGNEEPVPADIPARGR